MTVRLRSNARDTSLVALRSRFSGRTSRHRRRDVDEYLDWLFAEIRDSHAAAPERKAGDRSSITAVPGRPLLVTVADQAAAVDLLARPGRHPIREIRTPDSAARTAGRRHE